MGLLERISLIAAVLLTLAGCTGTRPSRPVPALPESVAQFPEMMPVVPPDAVQVPSGPPASPGNPPFYEVMGERYHVLPESTGYTEQGIASWYGREFHGKRTSNGEVYDMYSLTAAHKTLPLPTTARITNLATGRSIVVRVNDRGPFKKGRLIDLSYAAARDLGFLNTGTTMVAVEALPDSGSGPMLAATSGAATTSALSGRPAPGRMYVQVGAFGQQQNAEDLKRRLEQGGIANVVIRYDAGSESPLYRVRVGPVADAAEYDTVVHRVTAMNVREPRLVVEPGDLPGR